ncbi:MAG: VOC family protein [Candidatus Tumulicola sp.]
MFITVADIERSVEFYAKVFGAKILSKGDTEGAPPDTCRSPIPGSS